MPAKDNAEKNKARRPLKDYRRAVHSLADSDVKSEAGYPDSESGARGIWSAVATPPLSDQFTSYEERR
ncbi:MAG: hypothetical protein ACXVJO_16180, partial [Thermoanaerobaculia bacterium]